MTFAWPRHVPDPPPATSGSVTRPSRGRYGSPLVPIFLGVTAPIEDEEDNHDDLHRIRRLDRRGRAGHPRFTAAARRGQAAPRGDGWAVHRILDDPRRARRGVRLR